MVPRTGKDYVEITEFISMPEIKPGFQGRPAGDMKEENGLRDEREEKGKIFVQINRTTM
jgi:hypothetical protein